VQIKASKECTGCAKTGTKKAENTIELAKKKRVAESEDVKILTGDSIGLNATVLL